MLSILTNYFKPDFIKIVLQVTWWYAWMGLQITKTFEMIFRLLLSMPDNCALLYGLVKLNSKPIINTHGKKVNIINAYNEAGNITNKLKLFLQWYWTNADNEMYDSNGFNFNEFSKILNCSMLYCSYLLTDVDGDMSPEDFLKNVKKVVIMQSTNNENSKQKPRVYRSDDSDSDLSKKNLRPVLAGHVNFDCYDDNDENDVSDVNMDGAKRIYESVSMDANANANTTGIYTTNNNPNNRPTNTSEDHLDDTLDDHLDDELKIFSNNIGLTSNEDLQNITKKMGKHGVGVFPNTNIYDKLVDYKPSYKPSYVKKLVSKIEKNSSL